MPLDDILLSALLMPPLMLLPLSMPLMFAADAAATLITLTLLLSMPLFAMLRCFYATCFRRRFVAKMPLMPLLLEDFAPFLRRLRRAVRCLIISYAALRCRLMLILRGALCYATDAAAEKNTTVMYADAAVSCC